MKKGFQIFKTFCGGVMNGWEIMENNEKTSTRRGEVVARDIEFLGNIESSPAKEVHNKSMNGVVF